MSLLDLRSLNFKELEIMVTDWGYPRFRAKQIYEWVHRKGVTTLQQMRNLPNDLLADLSAKTFLQVPKVIAVNKSDDGTVKLLLEMSDGDTVETVLMNYQHRDFQRNRATVCVSTQVGCAMGCGFCATGLSGFKRNLSVGEIIAQIMAAQQTQQIKVTNVVFMGMGEPLLNYGNLLKTIRIINDEAGLNIGWRRITVSTCGIVPKIDQLAQEKLPLVLAISLHGATDKVRDKLMPVNKKYPLAQLVDTCHRYTVATGRRITFEYALIKHVNDSAGDAVALAELLRDLKCNVNLIPVNPVLEAGLERPNPKQTRQFLDILTGRGVQAMLREEKGTDIDAACGQLRGRVAGKLAEKKGEQ